MKMNHMHFILALVPLSMLAIQEPAHRSRNRSCNDCPITQTVCQPFCDGNGFIVTNEQGTTLEDAINAANASNATPCNPFVIEFDYDPTMSPINSGSYIIKKPVCINGFSNLNASESKRTITAIFSRVSLLLEKDACGSTIKGIDFQLADPSLRANIVVRAPNSRIYGNDFTQTESDRFGILVDHASYVTIGGLCPQERNVIQGRTVGLLVRSSNVTVVGNYIGPNECGIQYAYSEQGAQDTPGNTFGLTVIGDSNVIGCEEKCSRNVISGNCINSVLIGSCNKFRGNIVGLDASGKEPLIAIPDFSISNLKGIFGINNLIGHLSIGRYNDISKNALSGNVLRNLVILASAFNHVKKNLLGTNICGNQAFPTLTNAVVRFSSSNCIEENLISARAFHGLAVLHSSNNTIKHNVIGSDLNKTFSLGQEVGLLVSNSVLPELNLAPTCLQTLLSLFQSNDQQGLFCFSPEPGSLAKDYLFEESPRSALTQTLDSIGQMLGQNPAQLRKYESALQQLRSMNPAFGSIGAAPQHNTQRSIQRSPKHNHSHPHAQLCSPCHPAQGYNSSLPGLHESVNNLIEDNEFLGNLRAGVVVSGARLTTIEKNFIGTSKKCCVVPNGYGVLLKSNPLLNCTESCKLCCCCQVPDTGGAVAEAATRRSSGCCVVDEDQNAANTQLGFELFNFDGSQCNLVQKNFIAGNLFNGVAVDGVTELPLVPFKQSFDNAILKNSIFNNCASGIRLNHNGNRCLPAPVIISALRIGDKVEVEIDRQSLPGVPFLVELYGNTRCRAGITEGEIFLCCKTVVDPFLGPLKLAADIKCSDVKFVTVTVSALGKCGVPVNTSEFACPLFIVPLSADQAARKAKEAVVEEQGRARDDLIQEEVYEEAEEQARTEKQDLEQVKKAVPVEAPEKKELVLSVPSLTLKLQEALRDY